MNLQEFKVYATENADQAALEICAKAHNQRVRNKISAFDQVMEKNILKIKGRISVMLESLTEESYEGKKTQLILALSCDKIKAKCHSEVFNRK